MPGHTLINLKQVKDQAVDFGYSPDVEARFASDDLGAEQTGLSYQRLAPGVRQPFAHHHGEHEELYVVLSGGGRIKLDEQIVELAPWDAVRVPPQVTRAFEAGPDGIEIIAFGPRGMKDGTVVPGWWT